MTRIYSHRCESFFELVRSNFNARCKCDTSRFIPILPSATGQGERVKSGFSRCNTSGYPEYRKTKNGRLNCRLLDRKEAPIRRVIIVLGISWPRLYAINKTTRVAWCAKSVFPWLARGWHLGQIIGLRKFLSYVHRLIISFLSNNISIHLYMRSFIISSR